MYKHLYVISTSILLILSLLTAAPAENQPAGKEDRPFLKTGLPDIDSLSYEYISFRHEIMRIILNAEKESRIKSTYGVFVMDLTNRYYCGINESLTRVDDYDGQNEGYFNSASVVKLFQGYILCDMLRNGELSEAKHYHDVVTGRKFTLLNMITTMISRSDNDYSNASLRLTGNKLANEVLNRLGIINSRIYGEMSGATGYSQSNNLKRYGTIKRCARITPRDAGLILYNVYMNKETDVYMGTMNRALLGNIYNTRIPAGVKRVDPNYKVAHKTGTNSLLGVYNDAGIIYGRRPFILVVFTQSTSDYTGHTFIKNLSEDLTRYFDARASQPNQP